MWADILFKFQWDNDKLSSAVRLGPGFILIILRGFPARKNCLAKNLLEKETRQKASWRFCDHYVWIPQIEKQPKWKYLGNNSGSYWYLHNLRKKMFHGSVEICSFECWRSPSRATISYPFEFRNCTKKTYLTII